MGLIVDSGVFVNAEQSGMSISDLVQSNPQRHGRQDIAISAVTVTEPTHGIYRAPSPERSAKRERFVPSVLSPLTVHSSNTPTALVSGRIEGQQAARGIVIPRDDLIIGTTAIQLGYAVLTTNPKHFQLIPGLTVEPF